MNPSTDPSSASWAMTQAGLWHPRLDLVPPLMQGIASRALLGNLNAMIRMNCAECVGCEQFRQLLECGPCCPLYPFRKEGPVRPIDGGWTSPACLTCTSPADSSLSDPTVPRFPAAETIARARRVQGCRELEKRDLERNPMHMPLSRPVAVKLHCAACMGDTGKAVDCTIYTCWLWLRRGGLVDPEFKPLVALRSPVIASPTEDIAAQHPSNPRPLRQPRMTVPVASSDESIELDSSIEPLLSAEGS